MSTLVASATTASSAAQIAALERQLAAYEKQLQTDAAAGGGTVATAATQLVATEISLVDAEIAALSQPNVSPVTAAATSSRLGTQLNVTA